MFRDGLNGRGKKFSGTLRNMRECQLSVVELMSCATVACWSWHMRTCAASLVEEYEESLGLTGALHYGLAPPLLPNVGTSVQAVSCEDRGPGFSLFLR